MHIIHVAIEISEPKLADMWEYGWAITETIFNYMGSPWVKILQGSYVFSACQRGAIILFSASVSGSSHAAMRCVSSSKLKLRVYHLSMSCLIFTSLYQIRTVYPPCISGVLSSH